MEEIFTSGRNQENFAPDCAVFEQEWKQIAGFLG